MKKIRETFVLIALLTSSLLASAQAYKCKDASGAVKYQQAPCSAPSEDKVRLFYETSPQDAGSGKDVLAEALPPAIRANFESLVSERKVAVGMTAKMVQRSWGLPKRVNSSIHASSRFEQWVYESEYVYLENGLVTSLQTSR